ncbi:MAG TPA: hypothetical protein VIL97_04785, partial [Thermoanaerobaculia bacterium]
MKKTLLSSLALVALVSACAKERPTNDVATAAAPAATALAPATAAPPEPHVHETTVTEEAVAPSVSAVAAEETPPKTTPVVSTKSAQLAAADLAATIVDAKRFDDPSVRETYANAKDIADRLDQMYCYCRCKENEGLKHKSL